MNPDKPAGPAPHDTDFAALWSSDGVTRSFAATGAELPADLPFLFAGGQRLGPYLVVRPIGKGGMGQVYEAEETDSGRRVALKLLSRGLGDDEERERFLREGQLAASLSHPNCVYVFGTSEIQGFPVIAMELVPDGTLKDLVIPETPISAAAAVDAVLPVIAGLEAAASIGILHRDVKPSNCFVHRDGRVLVGDFGLSVAATSRDAQGGSSGTILGTPGFASPEQLRGENLDVRSDIYAVGATLFYLLAGRAPFDDRSTTALLARVATEPPPSLLTIRPELPRGLAAVVAKCLAKTPAERYASYAALRAALEQFGASRVAPAPIVRRTLAGAVDAWLVGLPVVPVNLLLMLQPLTASHRGDRLILAVASLLFMVLYYGLLEGRLGASAGKALFGLRVVDEHQVTPGFNRAAVRVLVFEGPTQLLKQAVVWLMLRLVPDISVGFVTTVTGVACLAILFSTARRKNGYTALHDRLTRTRVVKRRIKAEARERVEPGAARAPHVFDGATRVGPYLVPASTPAAVQERTRIEGFDDRLQRPVWIDLLPPGTPPLAASRRDVGRSTRVRWLAGRRDGDHCWDAYEAVDGVSFEAAVATAQPWARVRHWLCDLAQECVAGLADGSLPALDLSHVWIGRDGHARILDWNPGAARDDGAPVSPVDSDVAGVQRFLHRVANATTSETPLPLNARSLVLSLRDARFTSPAALLEAVSDLPNKPAAYPRSRRAIQIGIAAAFPIIVTVVALVAIFVLRSSKAGDKSLFTLDACLNELERTEKTLKKGPDARAQQVQDDVQIYMAEHLAAKIQSEDTWTQSIPNLGAKGGRARALRALDAHRVRTPEEVRRADATVATLVDNQGVGLEKLMNLRGLAAISIAILGVMFVFPAILAGIGALAIGTGFTFRLLSAALVNRRGEPISRLRALLRAVLTWSPVVAVCLLLKNGSDVTQPGGWRLTVEIAVMLLFAAAAAAAIARPSRGIQDRIAGTWIVPR